MTSAFIVHLVVSDTSPAFLDTLADDLANDLAGAGHDVEEVRPWARQEGLGIELPPMQSSPDQSMNAPGLINPFGQ